MSQTPQYCVRWCQIAIKMVDCKLHRDDVIRYHFWRKGHHLGRTRLDRQAVNAPQVASATLSQCQCEFIQDMPNRSRNSEIFARSRKSHDRRCTGYL